MITFKKPSTTDIPQHAAGIWIGVRWWLFGDWPSRVKPVTQGAGRRYADIYVSFFPGCPIVCLRYYNKQAWRQKIRDGERKESK